MSYNVTVSGKDYEGIDSVKLPITGTNRYKTFGDVDGIIDGTIESVESDTATRVKKCAFADCKKLKTAKLPNAERITISAFDSCSALSEIDFSNAIQIQNNAFYGCSSLAGEYVFPKVTWPVGTNAFTNCTGITKMVLPVVQGTNSCAFKGCSGLKVLDLGSAIGNTTIAADKIDSTAFEGLTNLEALILRNPTKVVPLDSVNAFYTTPIDGGTASNTCFIYVPSALVDSYYPDICG